MEALWAPWRMEYIRRKDSSESCVFCPGEDRNNDVNRFILYLGKYSMVLMNKYPYNNAHLLVAPLRHTSSMDTLDPEEACDLMDTVRKTISVMEKLVKPDGFNVGLNLGKASGAGIAEHIHFHVVPRWIGDVNFMTTCSETRVISEHIRDTFETFAPVFAEAFKMKE